jgi:hypothetical protein
MKFIDAIQFKDEDFEETVATIHKGIRHLGKAGWKSTLRMTFLSQTKKVWCLDSDNGFYSSNLINFNIN